MIRLAAIATVNLSFATPAIDANEVNRDQRIYSISIAESRAVEHATCSGEWASVEKCRPIFGDADLAGAFVTVIAKEESALRRNVGADECKPWECDPKRWKVKGVLHVQPQARSYWQIHRKPIWTDEKWASLAGLSQEATDNAVWEAMKLIAGGYSVCGTIEGAFTYYKTSKACHDYTFEKTAKRRAALVVSVRARLVRLQHQDESSELQQLAIAKGDM